MKSTFPVFFRQTNSRSGIIVRKCSSIPPCTRASVCRCLRPWPVAHRSSSQTHRRCQKSPEWTAPVCRPRTSTPGRTPCSAVCSVKTGAKRNVVAAFNGPDASIGAPTAGPTIRSYAWALNQARPWREPPGRHRTRPGSPASAAERFPPPRPRRSPVPSWTLPIADFMLALVAFVLGYIARYHFTLFRAVMEINQAPFDPYIPFAIFYAHHALFRPPQQRPLPADAGPLPD